LYILPFLAHPDAIFIVNSVRTTGALLVLKELKIKIPEEIGIVGFDDLEWTSLMNPPLITISQPIYTIGSVAAQLFFIFIDYRPSNIKKEVVSLLQENQVGQLQEYFLKKIPVTLEIS